jgi:hypothetical protein
MLIVLQDKTNLSLILFLNLQDTICHLNFMSLDISCPHLTCYTIFGVDKALGGNHETQTPDMPFAGHAFDGWMRWGDTKNSGDYAGDGNTNC